MPRNSVSRRRERSKNGRQEGKTTYSVKFEVEERRRRLQNRVVGKENGGTVLLVMTMMQSMSEAQAERDKHAREERAIVFPKYKMVVRPAIVLVF